MGTVLLTVVVEVVVPMFVVVVVDDVVFDAAVVGVDDVGVDVGVDVVTVVVGVEVVVGDVGLETAVIAKPQPCDGSFRLSGAETGSWNVVDVVDDVDGDVVVVS
ncbi:MAG: hypothetical protein ACYDB2_10655 [Acidimicrobiales bacterium]